MIARTHLTSRVPLVAALVALAALLAYGSALAGSYVFDDLHSVAANPAVHDLGNLGRFWTDPSAFSAGGGRMYRPVLLASFALNLASSPEAWSAKAGNLLLHAATSVLLFVWLWRVSRRLRAAGIVAAGFAVHPLASEAVNLVSARSELLAAAGMLTALLAHLSWQRGQRLGPLLGMLAGTVIACGSKETGVVLPCLCAAQAVWLRHAAFDRRDCRRLLVGLAPMIAAVVLYLLARKLLLGQVAVPLLGREGGDPAAGYGRTLTVQLATMGAALPGSLLQMLVPWRLSLDPALTFHDSLLRAPALLGWGALTGLTAWALWPGPGARLRRLGVTLAWLTALPWIVVPLNMPLAEHRLYAPLLGAAAVAVAVAPRLHRWLQRAPHWVPGTVAATVLLLLAWRSADRSLLYRDERELWRAELAHRDDAFRPWWGLGTATLRAGDAAGAVPPLARAHALYPAHGDTHRNYAEALVSVPDAQADVERSLAVTAALAATSPRDPWVRTLVVQAELQAGRVRGDREHFARAERLALSCFELAEAKGYVYRLAAMACRGLGDLPRALDHLDASIARGLAPLAVRLDRAALLRELDRADDARRELLLAAHEYPGDPDVMQALQQLASPAK